MPESSGLQHELLEQQDAAPSPEQRYSAGAHEEENDPDSVLPNMLFEQESHDLFCPMCEHAVTGEVILQKRKREVEPGRTEGRPHGIQANVHDEILGPILSKRVTQDSYTDSTEEDDLGVRSTLQEQTNYDLLCPDCESCITHEVILQKRKRGDSTSDTLPRTKPSTEGLSPRRQRRHSHPGRRRIGEGIDHPRANDPPLKRQKESESAADTEAEATEIRPSLQYQRIYDLSCPDCTSPITYRVTLEEKTSASGKPVGLLAKRGRRHRKSTSSVDDNPWKTRYKLQHGHSKPSTLARGAKHGQPTTDGSIAKLGEPENPPKRRAKHGTAVADRSIAAQPEERGDPQSREAKQGTVMGKKSSAQPDERQDPQSGAANYETDIAKTASLKEPLLPEKEVSTGEADMPRRTVASRFWEKISRTEGFVGPALTYFITILFLYCVWFALDRVPP